jgi:hypothetical protein
MQRQQQQAADQLGPADAALGRQVQFGGLGQGEDPLDHLGQAQPRLGHEEGGQGQALHVDPAQVGQRHAGDAQAHKAGADAFGDEDLVQHVGHAAGVQVGAGGDGAVPAQALPIGADFGRAAQAGQRLVAVGLALAVAAAVAQKRKHHRSPPSDLTPAVHTPAVAASAPGPA